MRLLATLLSTGIALSLLASSTPASANCAAGDDYSAQIDGSSVRVCPFPTSAQDEGRTCPDPVGAGLLRESLATGEAHLIPATCVTSPWEPNGAARCYLDECVPPGAYRYGFAEPWRDPFCGGCPPSQFFVQVDVTDELGADCTRGASQAEPVAFAGSIPWGDDPNICDSRGFGCTLRAQPRQVVLGVNAIVGLLGVAFMARRRRHRRVSP